EGVGRNTSAIGARVEVRTGKRTQFREIHAGGVGYMGQNTLEAHFGLGGLPAASGATVRFPDGAVRELSAMSAGAYLVVHPALLGDGNYDQTITAADRPICQSCITAALPPRAGSPCARFDYDGNLQLDAADLAAFDADLAHARADLDDDGVVGSRDIAIMLNQWGTAGPADLDSSGSVGPADVALLLQSWG
ncbi:MAG: UnbV, partial [Planctomycetota bacterium]